MAATFTLFHDVFAWVDEKTATIVNDTVSNSAQLLTGPITFGLTIAFLLIGLNVMLGGGGMGAREYVLRSFRTLVIAGFALGGGLYQTQIAQSLRTLPDEVASAVVSGDTSGSASILDEASESAFKVAGDAWEKGGFMKDHGVEYLFAGAIVLITSSIFIAVGAGFLIAAKIIMAILAGIGPIFILALLFDWSKKFFELWLAAVLAMVALVLLFASVFGLMCGLYNSYAQQLAMDGTQNMALAIGGLLVLAISLGVALVALPRLAAQLTGGAAFSGFGEVRQLLPQPTPKGGNSENNSSSGSASKPASNSGQNGAQAPPAAGHARTG